jgi:hypothetical protein
VLDRKENGAQLGLLLRIGAAMAERINAERVIKVADLIVGKSMKNVAVTLHYNPPLTIIITLLDISREEDHDPWRATGETVGSVLTACVACRDRQLASTP